MSRDFKIIVPDGTERATDFMQVFGRHDVFVTSFIPEVAELSGLDEPQLVYMLDLNLITADERARLIRLIAQKFGANETLVADALDLYGLPIRASGCTLVVENPMKWMD